MTTALASGPRQSVFTGLDICREAGWELPDGTQRPVFEDDRWDVTAVIGLPNQMSKVSRRFDFTAITKPHLAGDRQGTDHGHARPQTRGRDALAAGLPDPAAPADRVGAVGRVDSVPELAHPRATRRSTRRDHPSAGRRHLRQPSQPTSATGSDHRLLLLTERPGRQRSGVGVRTKGGGRPRYDGNRRPVILR